MSYHTNKRYSKKHKEYLQVAELQLSNFGLTPPISLVLDIKECKNKIAQLERDIVNLRNSQRKKAGEVLYKDAEDIVIIEDTDGVITYCISLQILDINIPALNTPIFDGLVKTILGYFQDKGLDVELDFGGSNIKTRKDMYSDDHDEIVRGVRMHIKSLEDRNVSGIYGSLAFNGGSERIGFIIWNTDSHISIRNTERDSSYPTVLPGR